MDNLTNLTYDDVVKTAELTCEACPTIYEGLLTNYDSYYVRYRNGVVRFENETKNLIATASLSRMADGYLDYYEFKEYVVSLYAETLVEWDKILEDLSYDVRTAAEAMDFSDELIEELLETERLEELVSEIRSYSTTVEDYVKAAQND